MQKLGSNSKARKYLDCLIGICCFVLIVTLLLFLIVFVIVPIVFKYSPDIQRKIILPTWAVLQTHNYSDVEAFGIKGVKNFYINTNDQENVTIGIWQILPEEMLSEFVDNDNYNYDDALKNEKHLILLYMHGNGSDRTYSLELYDILRKYFHIFAVDYRGYADSSKAEMNEEGIVNDMVSIYKWLRKNSKARIFIWGHSLGTGIGTHLVSILNAEKFQPAGLILETPFTSVTDVMLLHPIIQVYSWFPWCNSTMLDPIVDNGLDFNSKKYILDVDCPIMILHAKDDDIIPYTVASNLYEIAVDARNSTVQGNITYHLFAALGYRHMSIYAAPELPNYVRNFIKECLEFVKKKL